MLRALLLDLGETLVHEDAVLPHVPEALDALSRLPTGSGQPLQLALVSDYTMPDPAAGDGEVAKLFAEYLAKVRSFGLLRFFEPPDRHVTLSTQARVRKPDPQIFRLALRRLGLDPELSTAMFITEDPGHVAAARSLGMTALQYGADFDDWSAAPLLAARALQIADAGALLEAANLRLRVLYELRIARLERSPAGEWLGETVAGERVVIAIDSRGDVASVERVGPPNEREQRFRQMLKDNEELAPAGEPLPPGATHVDEPGPGGTPRSRRKRFKLV